MSNQTKGALDICNAATPLVVLPASRSRNIPRLSGGCTRSMGKAATAAQLQVEFVRSPGGTKQVPPQIEYETFAVPFDLPADSEA